MKTAWLGSIVGLAAMAAQAKDLSFTSGPARVHLLELYTSEGCSSCPPAERWFSGLLDSPRLWKEVVPVAFHVDYWDHLGWADQLASRENTCRQQRCAAAWGNGTLYTPGFVLDGKEWRARNLAAITPSGSTPGTVSAIYHDDGSVSVSFQPPAPISGRWEAHAVLLGFARTSRVTAGENRGETLVHDFASLDHETSAMQTSGGTATANLRLPAREKVKGALGLAVWVTAAGNIEPIQATGGRL